MQKPVAGRASSLLTEQPARLTLQNGEPNWTICAGPPTLTAQESGVPIRQVCCATTLGTIPAFTRPKTAPRLVVAGDCGSRWD